MNSGGNFLKNRILNFTKKNNNEDEDVFDDQDMLNDEEFFDEFFANSNEEKIQYNNQAAQELPTPMVSNKPEPVKTPINNPVSEINKTQVLNQDSYNSDLKMQVSTQDKFNADFQASTKTQATQNNNYKYDYAKMNDYSSKANNVADQNKVKNPVQKSAPVQKEPNYSYNKVSTPKEQNYTYNKAPEAKVYAIVLKSADDVRAVVDCMMQKQIVAIYVDMTTLSKLEERRALDFIDGAKYVLKTNVKCISSKIYMVTPKNVSMDGDFMDFNEKNQYARAQGENSYF